MEGLLLGLSTGPVCLAWCAPIMGPLLASESDSAVGRHLKLLGSFLGGRLAGYLLVGLAVGMGGEAIAATSASRYVFIPTILIGVALFVFGVFKNFPEFKLCQLLPAGGSGRIWSPALGLLTGLSPCPPFVGAVTGAFGLGSVSGALAYFLFFFMGTAIFSPFMLVAAPLARVERMRELARVFLLVAGAWFVYRGTAEMVVVLSAS